MKKVFLITLSLLSAPGFASVYPGENVGSSFYGRLSLGTESICTTPTGNSRQNIQGDIEEFISPNVSTYGYNVGSIGGRTGTLGFASNVAFGYERFFQSTALMMGGALFGGVSGSNVRMFYPGIVTSPNSIVGMPFNAPVSVESRYSFGGYVYVGFPVQNIVPSVGIGFIGRGVSLTLSRTNSYYKAATNDFENREVLEKKQKMQPCLLFQLGVDFWMTKRFVLGLSGAFSFGKRVRYLFTKDFTLSDGKTDGSLVIRNRTSFQNIFFSLRYNFTNTSRSGKAQ